MGFGGESLQCPAVRRRLVIFICCGRWHWTSGRSACRKCAPNLCVPCRSDDCAHLMGRQHTILHQFFIKLNYPHSIHYFEMNYLRYFAKCKLQKQNKKRRKKQKKNRKKNENICLLLKLWRKKREKLINWNFSWNFAKNNNEKFVIFENGRKIMQISMFLIKKLQHFLEKKKEVGENCKCNIFKN